MATGGPVEELCEEATCSVCQDYFKDPVMIAECGHDFCRGCLAQCWGEDEASCPKCRGKAQPKNLQPSQRLAHIVEIAKKLSTEAKKGVCEKHQEPLKLFCQTDLVLICVICDRSKEHKNHEVIPAGEASEEYKNKIVRKLETLNTEKEKILAYLAEVKNESQEMLKTAESERQKTMAEFRELHQLLNEQENRLLAQVEEVEKEITRRREEHLARLFEELSSLESLIQEMEEKNQQPETELLQDVRNTLQRCEQKKHFENSVAFPPVLKRNLQESCDISPCLGSARKKFKDTLVSVPPQMEKANVTLDPTTASPKLILSEDRRSIKYQREAQDEPVKSYNFVFVLGREGFTRGYHFWEVILGGEDGWAVGVARKCKRAWDSFTPENGIWAVGKYSGQFRAFIKGIDPPLSVSGELKKIRVCLNYEGEGRVAFYDADVGTLFYAFSGAPFSGAPFSGETLYPFFAVYNKGFLRLSS